MQLKRRLSAVEARRRLIAALTDFAVIVAPQKSLQVVKADPADNRVLEAAAAGSADHAVSATIISWSSARSMPLSILGQLTLDSVAPWQQVCLTIGVNT